MLRLGELVEAPHGHRRVTGRIVEDRGNLGSGDEQVFRVKVYIGARKPLFLDVLASQLVPVPAPLDYERITACGLFPNAPTDDGLEEPDAEEISAARIWIHDHAAPTKTIRPRHDSYELKHVVERWWLDRPDPLGKNVGHYVSNGAFIRAAELEGYRIKRVSPRSPNAFFNMRLKSKTELFWGER